jgi:inosine-uridine nucleoside N-ribohydrolase
MSIRTVISAIAILLLALPVVAQSKRKVIIDQDARGPATTDQQSILVFLQSPEVETLGITVVSGDQWRDEEIAQRNSNASRARKLLTTCWQGSKPRTIQRCAR